MSQISLSKLNYLEGQAEAYAETVARTDKPLAVFGLSFDDEKDNWETMNNLEKSIVGKAVDYGIKCYVRDYRQEYRDFEGGPIFTTPGKNFCYYKTESVLQEYLSIAKKETLSKKDHKRLGKIFGYKDEVIKNFLLQQA